MGESSVSAKSGKRVDPLRGFRFRVTCEPNNFVSAGFRTVSGLNSETEVTEYREGIDGAHSHKIPGISTFEDISLARGKCLNDDLQTWRNQVIDVEKGVGEPDPSFRRTVIIDLHDYQNERRKSWKVVDAWPRRLEHGDLDAGSSDVLLETLVLANEGIIPLK
jgi:phage tail-like protein